MSLFSKPNKFIFLATVAIALSACTAEVVPPVEQLEKVQKITEPAKTVIKQVEQATELNLYLCKNNKKVEVERQKIAQKEAKKDNITVNFQGLSYQLSPSVTRNGKKYTNIRWTWHEMRNGKAFLYDNTKRNLAENCVKQ
ncbi:opacity-associated protein B [Mannheimia varigena]|uniref:MliC family protein n=1 Tax=Mannheimia varigena TaxID=85404 RepID=UPI00159DD538|nr:MliC family protein [Mannheimia varigena]QLB16963.1 opacity-associated protein B [Mannheimia varigena]